MRDANDHPAADHMDGEQQRPRESGQRNPGNWDQEEDQRALERLASYEPKRYRGPKRIGHVVNQLIARRGYFQDLSNDELRVAWEEAAGSDLAADSRPTVMRSGVLEILVADSVLAQELTFRKKALLQKMAHRLPQARIRDLRFRVGQINPP